MKPTIQITDSGQNVLTNYPDSLKSNHSGSNIPVTDVRALSFEDALKVWESLPKKVKLKALKHILPFSETIAVSSLDSKELGVKMGDLIQFKFIDK